MFGQEILPICLNFLSSTNAFVLEITCVFLRLSTPWVLSIKSFQLCVFIKIELLWLSYDKICWSTNLRPLSWVAMSWWTLSASRHWWRAFLFFSRSFCVWNHQKEFYVQKIESRIGVGGPFIKTIVYLIQLLMKHQHFWPQPCQYQIRWRTTTGTSRTARFPTQRPPWSSKWRLTRAALMRWSEFLPWATDVLRALSLLLWPMQSSFFWGQLTIQTYIRSWKEEACNVVWYFNRSCQSCKEVFNPPPKSKST